MSKYFVEDTGTQMFKGVQKFPGYATVGIHGIVAWELLNTPSIINTTKQVTEHILNVNLCACARCFVVFFI